MARTVQLHGAALKSPATIARSPSSPNSPAMIAGTAVLIERPGPAKMQGDDVDGLTAEIDAGDGQRTALVAPGLALPEWPPRQDCHSADRRGWRADHLVWIGVCDALEPFLPHVRHFRQRHDIRPDPTDQRNDPLRRCIVVAQIEMQEPVGGVLA
jgi:hypothetical protein